MKYNKKIFLFLACLWFLISFLVIRTTYAKYITSLDSSANVGISQWNIVLNNQDINNTSDISATIPLTFEETDYHIADVIVPGAIGYFDLNIDSTDVSLPFDYYVNIGLENNNEIADVKMYGYSLSDNPNHIYYITSSNIANQMSGTIRPHINSLSIRIYVIWDDNSSTETLDDDEDTSLALSSAEAKIKTTMRFVQIAN